MCKQCGTAPARNARATYCGEECLRRGTRSNQNASFRRSRERERQNRPRKICVRCKVTETYSQHPHCQYCEPCKIAREVEVKREIEDRVTKKRRARKSPPVFLPCEMCGLKPRTSSHNRARFCLECRITNRKQQRALFTQKYGQTSERRQQLRDSRLRRVYGVDSQWVRAQLQAQAGLCRICSCILDETTACVDHCHATGRVREILCVVCNFEVGKLEVWQQNGKLDPLLTYIAKHHEVLRVA